MSDWRKLCGGLAAVVLATALIAPATGCGESPKKPKKTATKKTESPEEAKEPAADAPSDEPAKVAAFEFTGDAPALEDPFPAQDDGRVVIRPPAGWHRHPRSPKYLAMFTAANDVQYPRVVVLVEDAGGATDLTEGNLEERAAEKAASSKHPVMTATLGSRPALYWRAAAQTTAGVDIDHEVFETVVDGRRYTVELRTNRGEGAKDRPTLVAVARGVEFPKAAPSP